MTKTLKSTENSRKKIVTLTVDKDFFIHKELMGLNKSENPKVTLTKNVWQELPIASQYLLPSSPLLTDSWAMPSAEKPQVPISFRYSPVTELLLRWKQSVKGNFCEASKREEAHTLWLFYFSSLQLAM